MITTNSLVIGLLLAPIALVVGWRARGRLARFDARTLRAEIDAWRRLAHDAHRPVGEPTPADMGAFPTDVTDFDWTFLP